MDTGGSNRPRSGVLAIASAQGGLIVQIAVSLTVRLDTSQLQSAPDHQRGHPQARAHRRRRSAGGDDPCVTRRLGGAAALVRRQPQYSGQCPRKPTAQ